jgi:hypothetical protein
VRPWALGELGREQQALPNVWLGREPLGLKDDQKRGLKVMPKIQQKETNHLHKYAKLPK